jgi:hypothetical protein
MRGGAHAALIFQPLAACNAKALSIMGMKLMQSNFDTIGAIALIAHPMLSLNPLLIATNQVHGTD